ncbi:MAG TPA: DUF4258 domain-containing protein [Kiritimatiellia bacterium]|nr:DUF4258 domain-containing protein [Kiritimatiellia bacterium]
MSQTLEIIKLLLADGKVRISEHGYDELAADGLFVRDLVEGLVDAELLEDYPDFPKGPCILVLERDRNRQPVHVVWGIPKGRMDPAVLITAYRPEASRWSDDFRRRK